MKNMRRGFAVPGLCCPVAELPNPVGLSCSTGLKRANAAPVRAASGQNMEYQFSPRKTYVEKSTDIYFIIGSAGGCEAKVSGAR